MIKTMMLGLVVAIGVAGQAAADTEVHIPVKGFTSHTLGMSVVMLKNVTPSATCSAMQPDDILAEYYQSCCRSEARDSSGRRTDFTNFYFSKDRLARISSFHTIEAAVENKMQYLTERMKAYTDIVPGSKPTCTNYGDESHCRMPLSAINVEFRTVKSTVVTSISPNVWADSEYKRSAAKGPVTLNLYEIEPGETTLAGLAALAAKNKWLVVENKPMFDWEKTGTSSYDVSGASLAPLHSLTLGVKNNTVYEINYWFINPRTTGAEFAHSDIDYRALLTTKYGKPERGYDDDSSEWHINAGLTNEVSVRLKQRGVDQVQHIGYTHAKTFNTIQSEGDDRRMKDLLRKAGLLGIDL